MKKKTLLATVAAATVVGFTSLAVAQGAMDQKGGGQTPGASEQKAAPGGGAAMHPEGAAPRSVQGGADKMDKTDKSVQGADKMNKPDKSAQDADKMNRPGKSADDADKMNRPGKSADDADKMNKPNQRTGQEQKNETTPQRGAQEENKAQPRGAQTESGKAGTNATADRAKGGSNVKLSSDQRSRISAVIGRSGGAARVGSNVNFNISVGTRVPRDVHVAVLPEDIVAIVPEYRGFDYIVVGDRILIIDPDSLEIVTIIES